MKTLNIKHSGMNGEIEVPGDKSISHRAIIFGSIARGETTITNFLTSEDCMRTVNAFRQFGVDIELDENKVTIRSEGIDHFKQPKEPIYLGNSGTTARLILGVCATLPFSVQLVGDESLNKRPMKRVIEPLEKMGAQFHSQNSLLPMTVEGRSLLPIQYDLNVPSAQVKSAIILASLFTKGETVILEKATTRDHTERMIPLFNGDIKKSQKSLIVSGKQQLSGATIDIPGDFSSAAFFIVGAIITEGSHITIKNVSLNPTRTGLLTVLKRMGAQIETEITSFIGDEPVGTIVAKHSKLTPTTIDEEEVPLMVDEIPLLALAATQAKGEMIIDHIKELRIKETDRIKATVNILKSLNGNIEEDGDRIKITGTSQLKGSHVESYNDHRMAMMATIASLIADGPVSISNYSCINISYPNFLNDLNKLVAANE